MSAPPQPPPPDRYGPSEGPDAADSPTARGGGADDAPGAPDGRESGWAPPPRPLDIRTLIALAALHHIAYAAVRVLLTLGALHVNATPLQVGLVVSLFALLPMFGSIPGGRWVDRIGPRLPMQLGIATVLSGLLVSVVWLSVESLMVTSVLVGIGYLPFHLAIQKMVSLIGTAETRRHNLSLMAIGYSVATFLGPIVAGFLIDGVGYRVPFAVLAVLPLGVLLWVRRLGDRLPGEGMAAPVAAQSLRIRDLLATGELRRVYLVVALLSAAWDIHQFAVPLYGARLGLSASAIGLILGAYALATLVVRMLLPLFLTDISEWRALLAAMLVATAVYAAYPFFSSLEALLALSFVLGLGLGVSQPMSMSAIARVAPADRLGEATGLRMMLVYGTQTALPTMFGALGGLIGIGGLFWGMAALLGGGLAGVLRGHRRRER